MQNRLGTAAAFAAGGLAAALLLTARAGQLQGREDQRGDQPLRPPARATGGQAAPADRPEARRTEHDKSDVFTAPAPSSPALRQQTKEGRMLGFDFGRDPLNAPEPFTLFKQVME